MIGWQCDQCEAWTADPETPLLTVRYDVELDGECDCDDDDDECCQPWAEAHLCTYPCLAAWAFDESVKCGPASE